MNSASYYEELIMPFEGDPHIATWMAYGATVEAWGTTSSYGASRLIARKDIIRIAANISRFEEVKIIINGNDLNEAKDFISQIKHEKDLTSTKGIPLPEIEEGGDIEFIKQPVNDLWMRDTGPVFVCDQKEIPYGINFNFNGWGQCNTDTCGWKKCPVKASNGIVDQRIKEDQKIADFIIQRTGVKKISTWLVMEGGGIEVNGQGTAICTESCILNGNRNPKKNKTEVENELFKIMGIKKVIWLPGIKGNDVTDSHVDFYARFVSETKVLLSIDNDRYSPDYSICLKNQEILSKATDAKGNKIIVIPIMTPDFNKVKSAVNLRNGWNKKSYFNKDSFTAGYAGFYLVNNCVLISKFGDETADKAAFDTFSAIFPEKTVIQITTDGIANGGGTIHCATQQQI